MNIGQPTHLKEKAKGGFTDKLRLEDGENIHRVIYGPVKVQNIFYPTLARDQETNELKQTVRMIKRPPEGCILDSLASFEKRVRSQKGEKNITSQLSPRNRWYYAVINRAAEEASIELTEYPYTVFKQVIDLEATRSTKNPNKLRHGLIFMYDLIITKTVEKGKPRQFGTKYHVEVDPENTWSGKVPVAALGMSAEELDEKLKGLKKFFSKADWELIENMDLDLEKEGEPDSPEAIAEKLKEFPILLTATNTDGSYMFPAIEEFKEYMQEIGVEFLESKKKPTTKTLGSGSDKTFGELNDGVEFEEEDEDKVEDADFEDLENEEEEEPKKKTGKKSPKKKPKKQEPEEEEEEEELDSEEGEEEEDELPDW